MPAGLEFKGDADIDLQSVPKLSAKNNSSGRGPSIVLTNNQMVLL